MKEIKPNERSLARNVRAKAKKRRDPFCLSSFIGTGLTFLHSFSFLMVIFNLILHLNLLLRCTCQRKVIITPLIEINL